MAVTPFGVATTPANGGSNSASPTVVTPPASMQAGDLVVVLCRNRLNDDVHAVSNAGGQTWTKLTTLSNGNLTTLTWFWCRFNGTWSASPSFSHGGTNNTCIMVVFRPTATSYFWELDVAEFPLAFLAPASPYDVTCQDVETLTDGAVVLASYSSRDDNTWVLQTAGWTSYASINNMAGQDAADQVVYKIMPTKGASGLVTSRQTTNQADPGIRCTAAFKEVGPISGSLAATQASDTLSAAADLEVGGASAPTQEGQALSASGEQSEPAINGTLDVQQENDQVSASGTAQIEATATLEADSNGLSSSGQIDISASGAQAQASDTIAASGEIDISGAGSASQEGNAISGAGEIAIGAVLETAEAGDTISGIAELPIDGAAAHNLESDTISASGQSASVVTGAAAITQESQTLAASGISETPAIEAALATDQESNGLAGAGTTDIQGEANIDQESQTLTSSVIVPEPEILPFVFGPVAPLTGAFSEWQFCCVKKWEP